VTGTDPLWHRSQLRSGSPTTSWYYGVEATRTYEVIDPELGESISHWGWLTSPAIDLSGAAEASLAYRELNEHEPRFDWTRVEISPDGGSSWSRLHDSPNSGGELVERHLDLAAYVGHVVRVRFWFGADQSANQYEGWFIDDVVVRASSASSTLVADFDGSPRRSCGAPLSVQLWDQSIGNPTSWQWSFGDGQSSTEQDPQHVYQTSGSFAVSLTVSDGTDSSSKTIADFVDTAAEPAVDFTATPATPLAGQAVAFADVSAPAASQWAWDFGDGASSTAQHPSHAYAFSGSYAVRLTATNACGSATLSRSGFITVSTQRVRSYVDAITWAPSGKKVNLGVKIIDNNRANVSGASVAVDVLRNGALHTTRSGTTGGNGTVTFSLTSLPAGCYGAVVRSVTASGLTWDGASPANQYCK
jgi:PKD repeat protein